jgi:hypothetical protein
MGRSEASSRSAKKNAFKIKIKKYIYIDKNKSNYNIEFLWTSDNKMT